MNFAADHIGFVLAAYGITFVVLAGLIAMVLVDLRAQRAALAELEGKSEGRRRRAPVQQQEQSS